MKPDSKLYICNDENIKFFGRGPFNLLQKIDEIHSINAAAKSLNMSYAKAFNIIKTAEAELGHDLLIKKSGGVSGGGSELTPFAYEFMDKYSVFEKKAKAEIDKIYLEVFEK